MAESSRGKPAIHFLSTPQPSPFRARAGQIPYGVPVPPVSAQRHIGSVPKPMSRPGALILDAFDKHADAR